MQRSDQEIILSSLLALCWAIQAAIVLQQLLGLCLPPAFINGLLLPEAAGRMAAKWDVVIYVSFIAVALAAGKMIFDHHHKPLNHWFLVFEGALTFLMVSALFKMVIYDNSPQLAQRSLKDLIIIAVVSKIFYPELKKLTGDLYRRSMQVRWASYADIWWVALIVLLIFMPDCERVVAMVYMGDWLHHFDFIIMSVGWASLFGQLPYVDVISQYGVGLPMIFARIIHAIGPFDYVQALGVMMWFVIIYFILMYFFVRFWLKSALIAGVAFLLVFRLQMFHYGVSPLVWCVASASPVRFGLDILWLTALVLHLRTGRSRWLAAAAIYCGFALFYMTSVGMSVTTTFYVYLAALLIVPDLRRKMVFQDSGKRCWFFMCWALPFISAFVFFGAALKGHTFQMEFWHNFFDDMAVFSHSGALPMWESLKYRHFWAFFMSMVLPFTYMATFLYIAVCLYLGKGPSERLFTAMLCVYGLTNYQYYVVRAAITSYYVDVLPFVLIVCFWFMRLLEFVPSGWQKRLKAAAVGLSFYALLTNQNYLAYPNVMNFSRNPMTDNLVIQHYPDRQGYFNLMYKNVPEKDKIRANDLGETQEDIRTEDDFKSDADLVGYFREHFDFRKDAALIKGLTSPQERVALISSFETRILIQANRAPFFYDFPILTSRPMTFRSFPSDAAHSLSFLGDTIGALEKRRPEYVFMEKVFMQNSLPASYYKGDDRRLESVWDIITFVKDHYEPYEEGQYLIAMKRKRDI